MAKKGAKGKGKGKGGKGSIISNVRRLIYF